MKITKIDKWWKKKRFVRLRDELTVKNIGTYKNYIVTFVPTLISNRQKFGGKK